MQHPDLEVYFDDEVWDQVAAERERLAGEVSLSPDDLLELIAFYGEDSPQAAILWELIYRLEDEDGGIQDMTW